MFDQQAHSSEGDTSDLVTVLRLAPMSASTRSKTIQAVRVLRLAISGGPEITMEAFTDAVASADTAFKHSLGNRHSQILSDCRRAIRAWADLPRRTLAIRVRGQIATLEDAKFAAASLFAKDKAKRVATAIDRLAVSQSTIPAGIQATAIVIEPLLRAAFPETFGVDTKKSLLNSLSYIRSAVALVDPTALYCKVTDTTVLSPDWQQTLSILKSKTPEHALSVTAIFARIAVRCDRAGFTPDTIPHVFYSEFIDRERATKSAGHAEKLRAAARIWDQCIEAGDLDATPFELNVPVVRLPNVAWTEVPAAIREPFEALRATIKDPQGEQQWSDAIAAEANPEDAELGILGLDSPVAADEQGLLLFAAGTVGNWQNAVKRIWHAAQHDGTVIDKPQTLMDLFDPKCVMAALRGIRKMRRIRVEASGATWESKDKGRYETCLFQAFLSVGREIGISEDRLQAIQDIVYRIDPSIIGTKRQPDGSTKHIYEDRKIGLRHVAMLKPFSNIAVMARWLEAPATLSAEVARMKRKDKPPTITEAALARTALVVQLSQRVAPLRRANLARLRIQGDTPHFQLPEGPGPGILRLPACEMKNLRAITVRIDPETVALIKTYRDIYRPVCMTLAEADPDNEHLFPGAESFRKERAAADGYASGFGYLTREKLLGSFSKHMLKYCMLRIDLHVMRHLAGKIILDQDPSAMALVQEILGHKKIETTRAYYAEVCQLVAQKRYLHLLDRATREALSRIDFTIILEKDLK